MELEFIFLAAGAVSLFAFLSVATWSEARARERRTQERYALLRQVAERPAESARLVVELLREEDARLEAKARLQVAKGHRDSLQAGLILIATGVGVAVMLGSLTGPDQPNIWTVGLIPALIGLVIVAFETFTGRAKARQVDSRP